MTSDLAKLMEYIDSLQTEAVPEPVVEIKNKIHPLLQAMQELKEESIVESTSDIKDQIEKAIIVDGGNIDEYFVRSSRVDKLGFSPKQEYKRHPDVDDPLFDVDYIGTNKGRPALWFYPALFYLTQNKQKYAFDFPYIWLVRIRPNAWLQPADTKTKTIQEPPTGKERVGILKKGFYPQAIFFKTAFDVVDKFVNHKVFHKTHGQVKGPQVDEEIAYHGTVDDINEFHPFTHFGTEKAAKDRMTYKKIKDGKIYKVDLDIKNPLTIKDFPGIHYDRQYAFELRDKGLISQEEMEAITFIQDKQELRKALLNKLNELGIDGFVYKNKYEDKGNISYVIVDPSQVKVLSVEPAAEEVAEASDNKVAYHVTPTQNLRSVMKTGLVPNIGGRSSKIAGEQNGIYLFPSVEAAEDAVMNWLGDEFDEDEPLTLLKVNIDGLEKYVSQGADYELIVNTNIEPNRIHKLDTQLEEASPDTLEGSFTPDLVESKTWLAKMLAKGLKGKNAGTIYVLGSWYGNMGVFLQQAGVKFDKLVLVEPDEEKLMRSKELLDTLNDDGKLILIHQKAEDVVFEKPGVVINTSCNETGPVFLTKLPDNMLCLLQARNNTDDVLFETDSLDEFVEYYPLGKTYYTGEKELIDPETEYTRYMIIGRSGSKIDETVSTGQGGGSAGSSGGQMVGGPTTYEQEYDMFKRKGPRRIMAMTETLDSSYEFDKGTLDNIYYFATDDTNILYKVIFTGTNLVEVVFYPEVEGERGEYKPTTELTGTGNSRKVFGTVVKIVQDYVASHKPRALYFTADSTEPSRVKLYNAMVAQADKALPDYYAEKPTDLSSGTAYMLKRKTDKLDEALDSSYPYEGKAISGRYTFETEDGVFYKVYFQGKDLVEIAFSAILPGEEENFRPDKTTITGTGNSRKVFGTVIKIVQEYVDAHEPKALYFISSDEPSRLRLYQTMTDQVGKALPDYYAVKPTDLGDGKAFMLKRKNTKVDEALDSSYKYRGSKQNPGNVFYFDTEDGQEYKVEFQPDGKSAMVAFYARGHGDQHKIGLTGTGNASKIFGTVINVIKDYVAQNSPLSLYFTASNSEPSRVKLYKVLAQKVGQALPGFDFANMLNRKDSTMFIVKHENAPKTSMALAKTKNAAGKALDKVFENSITLNKLYGDNKPHRDDTIWDYGTMIWDNEYPIETINPNKLNLYLQSQYRIEHYEELFDMMDEEQQEIVEKYVNDPNLSDKIIVLDDGYIVDGNHRALAAVIANKPIKYIDIGEEDESS